MRYLFYLIIIMSFNYAEFNWQDDGAPIRQGLHIEWQRTGDANSDGSMIYAWSDCRNGVRDVVAQKIDNNGNNLWGDHGVVLVNAEGRQEDPQLVTDGNGGAYVIWMDYRNESDSEGDIYAQHINSDGNIEWEQEGVAIVDQNGKQASPNICSDGNGGAYVIWKDNEQSSYGDIYASHLSSEGVVQSGIGVPIITYSSYRSSPSLNTAGSGDAVLAWEDDRNSDGDIYAQKINVANNTINTQWDSGGKLICDASGDQTSPRVDQYNGSNTILTWEDERNGVVDAYYQVLDLNGNEQLEGNGSIACSGDWDIIKPRVKAENSIAYIVWEDRRNGWTSDIYAQKINSSGIAEWGNGIAITAAEGSQTEPRLTMDGNGGVYFVWEDQRNSSSSGIDIYAQHVNNSGTITHDANGELICDADNIQFNPLVRNDGSGDAIIVWGDQRAGGSFGINVQNLTSSGITLESNGKESFFGIATDAANEPYEHDILYIGGSALVYWQDNRWGESKIYGSLVESTFDVDSDIFDNEDINGVQLSSLDLAQENPKAILIDNNQIFLSFKVEESPNENLYFQLLNKQNLSQIGNAVAISNPSTSKQGFEMTKGNDGFIYYAFSEEYDISINKMSNNGAEIWSYSVVVNSADDIIKSIYPQSDSGCIIIYESEHWETGSELYALAIDGDGSILPGWPVLLSNLGGNQYFEKSVEVDDGIFISFKTNTTGNYDVYGQHLLFNGSLNSGNNGIAIAENSNDQEESSITYNESLNEVFCCYQSSGSSGTDIYCNKIQLSSQSISDAIEVSSNSDNQGNPNVFWSGSSYLITWEDARNISDSDIDIYFQELLEDAFVFSDGGDPLCTFDMKQERPIISQYNSSSFIIIWEDYRSTGKEFCANLYGQTYSSGSGCPNLGDMNGDDTWNVLDIVALANCVLASNCGDLDNGCAGDMNGDDTWNVLDIVALANCVLASACDEI